MNSGSIPTDQPSPNEVEISLFGPGFGESVVCHLGDGRWMTVDSCLHQRTGEPIALDYLRGMGVDIATDVKLVVATHWDDDHIDGISQVFEQASSAKFACSGALRAPEFTSLLAAGQETKLVKAKSGISELNTILDNIRSTKRYRRITGADIWAMDGMVLLEDTQDPARMQVRSLAPSSHVVTSTLGRLSVLMPKAGEIFRRFHSITPNDSSVVLQLRFQDLTILLGGDLENGNNDGCGWRGVLQSSIHGGRRSQCFKIAHHGSQGADHPEVWATLVENDAVAILTPFSKGRRPLPTEQDVERILEYTAQSFVTVYPPKRQPKKRHLERTINEVLKNRSTVRATPGHIRVRFDLEHPSASPTVNLFSGATALSAIS